jgi:hypothetical protein
MGNEAGDWGTTAARVAWPPVAHERESRRRGLGEGWQALGRPLGGADSGNEQSELGRLRQLRSLSTRLAQALAVADIIDLLATSVAGDCGADTSVVYLIDPDQDDVLRLASAKGLPEGRIGPALLCRDGGALISRAVQAREPIVTSETDPAGSVMTVVACPLLLRNDTVGAFSYGFLGVWRPTLANVEYLTGASALVALALDRTAATERAREAQKVSDYLVMLVGRLFGRPAQIC